MASQSDLIAQLAERASKRIARRTVVALQRMKDGLQSGEDSGLRNLWDEICVQMQGQQSVFWDLYGRTLYSVVANELNKVPVSELCAMWLQTDEGEEWLIDREDEGSDIPACADDVAAHITQMVYDIAADWSNDRIRKYLERGLDDW